MTSLTDPAREFADLCVSLSTAAAQAGDEYLASAFGVEVWSAEFFQIIFCVLKRADALIDLISELDLDDDYKSEAVDHIGAIKNAFNKRSLSHPWNTNGLGASLLSAANVQPIKMLSALVRLKIRYPKLNSSELSEIASLVTELISWLQEHQLSEQDFIRQALIDGLEQFSFRLARSKWLGWGYTIHSLKDVIAAYMALEHATNPATAPDAEAVLRKTKAFVGEFFRRTGFAKEAIERADFLLRAYGAVSLIQHGTTVSGFLTHMTA